MSKVPCVNFGLLQEIYRVTDYVQLANPCLQEIAGQLRAKDVNDAIGKVGRFVAQHVQYALDREGQPASIRHTAVFKYHGPIYLADTGEVPYGWLLPNQTVNAGYGICFDMSVLACTLLRLKGVRAQVVLGAVLTTKRRTLRGFHAWVEALDLEGRQLVMETTSPRRPNIWVSSDIYGGKFPLTYEPICWFDEASWREDEALSKKYAEAALRVLQKTKRTESQR